MATLLQAESRRLYSWWWDSHISPKNPKWLHENLADMDAKVKAMIKLIEEDADSFATRAEMYYVKRPELIKLVEEFFRAYRALAEKYHHTAWEFRQPHWTMAESSPNQIPFSLSDISPSVSSELEHRTPQMPRSIRPLFESEDLQRDTSRIAFPFHPITRNQSYSVDNEMGKAKMGLKQLYEIFAEGQTRKVLDFQEEEKKIPGNTLYCLSRLAQRHKGKEKEEKTKCPQEEASNLSSENQNLNSQVLRESEQTGKDETEIHSLCKSLSKLETEKEAILLQYKECLERIYRLEGEMACAKEDTSRLNVEISTGAIKLKEMEIAKRGLEDEIQKMKNDNQILKEQNILLGLLIENLQNDIFYLRAVKWDLEEKVWLHVDERSALQQELYRLKEQVKDLDMRHRDVIQQVEFVGLNLWAISSSQKDLQDEKLKLEDCKKIEEKVVLLGKLEFGEKLVEISQLEVSVLDVNVKLDRLREELEKLEESLQPALGDKSESSISHIENLTQTTENLSNKSTLLKSSFVHVNVELDVLQKKLKCYEKTCHSLQDQNSCLLVERCSLISQIEASQTELRDLGKDTHYCLGEKKEVMLHQVHEVQVSLNDEGEDQVDFVRSSKTQLANLQNQICLLQEEAILSKREIEQALEEVLTADIVIFALRSCFLEMKELNSFLSKENQKHIEASKNAENLISELMQESFEQKEKVNLLLDKKDTLNIAICQLLQSLDIKLDNGSQDKIEGQVLLQQIFEQIQKMHTSSLDMEEEMRQLTSEKSVNISLIEQLKREASDLESQKNTLEQDLKISTEKLFFLQIEKNELLEVNKQLSEGLKEGHQLQEVLNAERSILSGKLSTLQKAYQMLSSENFKLCEENESCKEEFYCLKDEKYSLEEEYNVVLKEALVLSYLSLFLENFSIEKTSELKDLQINLDHLHEVNSELEEEVRLMNEKMGRVDKENLDLKESIEKLEKDRNHLIFAEDDLRRVKSINEELNREIRVWKDMFNQKEIELSVAHQSFQAKETENAELCKNIGALKEASNEANMMKGNLEKNVFILSEDKNQQRDVIGCLHKANGKLERAMTKLQKEIKEHKIQEEYLKSELQKEVVKADMWEMEAAELYENLQLSNVHSTIFAEKSNELIQEYEKEVVKLETIDKCFKNETQKKMHEAEILEIESAADADSEELGTIAVLEGENGVTGDFTVLFPLILFLRDSLTSLEELGLSLGKIHEIGNQETQDSLSASHQHKMSIQAQNQAHSALEPFRILELQKLQSKLVQAVEKAVQEAKRFLEQESSKVNAKLEVSVEEIKELNFESNATNAEVRLSNDISVQPQGGSMSNNVPDKDEIEVSNEKMKDIHLVHVSDSSSYQNGLDSYATGRRECVETNYQLLKVLKDSSDCSFGPNIRNRQELANDSDEDPMQYLQVDNRDVSEKAHKAPQEGDNKMVQRIASDIGRLMNIQARVQDLKNKIESLRKSNRLMVFEYDSLKGQLREVEQTVSQLVEMDDKLRKNAKEVSLGPFKSFEGLRKNGNLRRRRVSEQARNWSEKIGRLELDVQRIQFTLLRLEDKFECKARKHVERRSKVLLRDYLFGKKKRPVCMCVAPSARED